MVDLLIIVIRMSEVTERGEVFKNFYPCAQFPSIYGRIKPKTKLLFVETFLVGGGGPVRQFCWKMFTFQCTLCATRRLYKYMYMKGL